MVGMLGVVGSGVDEPSRVDGRSIACRLIAKNYESDGSNGAKRSSSTWGRQQNNRVKQSQKNMARSYHAIGVWQQSKTTLVS